MIKSLPGGEESEEAPFQEGRELDYYRPFILWPVEDNKKLKSNRGYAGLILYLLRLFQNKFPLKLDADELLRLI